MLEVVWLVIAVQKFLFALEFFMTMTNCLLNSI